MQILSKSEAQKQAQALREIPDCIIRQINQEIAKGYASGSKQAIYSRPHDMVRITWLALADEIRNKGYDVKAQSEQRDGEWLTITL